MSAQLSCAHLSGRKPHLPARQPSLVVLPQFPHSVLEGRGAGTAGSQGHAGLAANSQLTSRGVQAPPSDTPAWTAADQIAEPRRARKLSCGAT